MVNWKEINERYIKRGEFLINPQFLETWEEEVRQKNAGKVGEPYFYPDSMIEFAGYFHCKGSNYRECEGVLRGLAKLVGIPFPIISYTQICRRLNKLEINFQTVEENLVVGVDGTGEKPGNRGDWIRHKWKVRRGWIKVVVMSTPDGKTIDIRVGSETLDERKVARGMIRNNHKKIKKFMADGFHDCRDTFNLCEKYGIETAIKIRKNANALALGSPRRKQEVILYKKLGHEEWVKQKNYGLRWVANETHFSANKRIFGECVRATKKRNMYQEVKLKFWFYNKLKEIG